MVSESTARFAGGTCLTAKWADIVDPPPEETRTAEEVIAHVLQGLREQ